jgi:hypothetical protein
MITNRSLTAGLLLTLGLILPSGTAFADDNQFSTLTAQWWQTMLSVPPGVNPAADPTGADCMLGQRGPVWLLAGTFSGGSATRSCSIPQGDWLFFPVVNYVNFNTPNCNQGPGNLSVATLRSQIVAIVDGATNLSVTLDGEPVKNIARVKSVPFAVTLPVDNVFGSNPCGTGVGLSGVYSPAIDDGFYTLLPPLSSGKHTLHIYGQMPAAGVTVDVTYNLTIVPVILN